MDILPIHQLRILSPAYDPNFKPHNGSLLAKYNGARIEIKVSGIEVHACVTTKEYSFYVVQEQLASSSCSWHTIVETTLQQVIFKLLQDAVGQVEYLKSRREYHVN